MVARNLRLGRILSALVRSASQMCSLCSIAWRNIELGYADAARHGVIMLLNNEKQRDTNCMKWQTE